MGVTIRDTKFFEEKGNQQIVAYLQASKLMDLYLFCGVFSYLLVIYFGIQYFYGDSLKKKEDWAIIDI